MKYKCMITKKTTVHMHHYLWKGTTYKRTMWKRAQFFVMRQKQF